MMQYIELPQQARPQAVPHDLGLGLGRGGCPPAASLAVLGARRRAQAELAVHKKKIEELRGWLTATIAGLAGVSVAAGAARRGSRPTGCDPLHPRASPSGR